MSRSFDYDGTVGSQSVSPNESHCYSLGFFPSRHSVIQLLTVVNSDVVQRVDLQLEVPRARRHVVGAAPAAAHRARQPHVVGCRRDQEYSDHEGYRSENIIMLSWLYRRISLIGLKMIAQFNERIRYNNTGFFKRAFHRV